MRRIDPCLTLPVKGWVAFELSIYRTGGRGTPRKSWLGVLPSSQNPDHFSDQIMPFYTLVVRTSLPTWLLKVVLSLQTHNLVLVSFFWPYTLVLTSVIGFFFNLLCKTKYKF